MISQRMEQLVQDIFLQIRIPKIHDEVKEEPEAFLLSLLSEINKRLNSDAKYHSTLHHTVQAASFDSHVQRALNELGRTVEPAYFRPRK
jgi:hypothetical protein